MADCELSVHLVSTNVSDFVLSVLPVSVKESKSVGPDLEIESVVEPSICPVSINGSEYELSVCPVSVTEMSTSPASVNTSNF